MPALSTVYQAAPGPDVSAVILSEDVLKRSMRKVVYAPRFIPLTVAQGLYTYLTAMGACAEDASAIVVEAGKHYMETN